MKKDIEIPEVTQVYVAAVRQIIEQADDTWYVYLINDKNEPLENIFITTRGYTLDGQKQTFVTSTMRHKMPVLSAKSAAKIEFISPDVFEIFNEYWVTFFVDDKLMERKFTFGPYTIDKNFEEPIPVLPVKGLLVK